MEFILFEEEFFRGDAGVLQGLEDLSSGHPPGVFVRHQHGLATGEIFVEQCGDPSEYALSELEGLGVCRHLESRCYSFFRCHDYCIFFCNITKNKGASLKQTRFLIVFFASS